MRAGMSMSDDSDGRHHGYSHPHSHAHPHSHTQAKNARSRARSYGRADSHDDDSTKVTLQCSFPSCGKTFTRKDHLIRHAANHAQPNFHCSTCGRSFQRLDLLQRHEKRQICDDQRYPKRLRSQGPPPPGSTTVSGVGSGHGFGHGQDHGSHLSVSLSQPSQTQSQLQQQQQEQQHQHQHQHQHQQLQPHEGTSRISYEHDIFNPTLPITLAPALLPLHSPTSSHHGPHSHPHSHHHAAHTHTHPDLDPSHAAHSAIDPAASAAAAAAAGSVLMDSVDWGFGLWPPDPWEALLHDALAPVFDEPQPTTTDVQWAQLGSVLGSNARTQESAERGGGGGVGSGSAMGGMGTVGLGGVGVGAMGGMEAVEYGLDVGAGLLNRLLTHYPGLDFSLSGLTEAIELYWLNVAPSFPFVHRGTFDVDAAPPELVIMMAVTGAVHSTAPSSTGLPPGLPQLPSSMGGQRRDDRSLVRRVRSRLVEDRCGLDMDVATLQAYTLCHVYDTWYGDKESLFIAQCMWPVVVAHSRKKGIGVAGRTAPDVERGKGGPAAWVAWAQDEERRRAAFCILLIDTQISAFWNQHPSRQLSIFAHNLHLPAPKAQWEAPTATDWLLAREPSFISQQDPHHPHHLHSHQSPPPSSSRRSTRQGFHPGLHPEFLVSVVSEGYSSAILSALAADGAPPIRVDLDNSLSVTLILVGLLAIAWDCRTRGGMGIRFRDGTKHWRSIVLNAVVSLRASYELGVGHIPSCIETRDVRDTLAISIISILSDIPMLQVAAGATSICGASIGPKQYADSKRRLRLWAGTEDAWTCLWQSARYLRETLFSDWGLYSPWAVFLTTLVVWAYGSAATREDRSAFSGPSENPLSSATAMLDSIFASPTRVDSLDLGVADLIVAVANKLESTGLAVDHDNAGLLWRLTGTGKRR